MNRILTVVLFAACWLLSGEASQIHIGASTVNITPEEPVALAGQLRPRISTENATRIHAVALALESRDGDRSLDQAVSVSCDLVSIRGDLLLRLRQRLAGKIEGLDKVFLNATHTPVAYEDHRYDIPQTGAMTPGEYIDFLLGKLEQAVAESWSRRQPGKIGYGQGQAVVAQNRRATYADGTAQMYGRTDVAEFRGIEGQEEMARRIVRGWEEAYEAARLEGDPAQATRYFWNQRVLDKHRTMEDGTAEPYRMKLHALRLGDVAIATNPFELFTAYGIQMKARSPAVQSFVIQLAGPGTYLPTPLAVQGGGYSAVIQSSNVGPEGGQILVEETVAEWSRM